MKLSSCFCRVLNKESRWFYIPFLTQLAQTSKGRSFWTRGQFVGLVDVELMDKMDKMQRLWTSIFDLDVNPKANRRLYVFIQSTYPWFRWFWAGRILSCWYISTVIHLINPHRVKCFVFQKIIPHFEVRLCSFSSFQPASTNLLQNGRFHHGKIVPGEFLKITIKHYAQCAPKRMSNGKHELFWRSKK